MEDFSELLSRYIKRAGISDSELARAIGISRQTIFRWREGLTSRPNSREDVLAIAKKLRLSPDETNSLLLSAGFRPEEPAVPPVSPSDTDKDAGPAAAGDEVPSPDEALPAGEIETSRTAAYRRLKITPLRVGITIAVLACLTGIYFVANNWSDWFQSTTNGASVQGQPSVNQTGQVAPAASDELLVLVAPLSDSASVTSLTDRLADSIEREAQSNRVSNLRVDTVTDSIGKSEAEALLRDYNARLVVYADDENGGLSISLTPCPMQPSAPTVLDGTDVTGERVRALSLLVLSSVYLNRDDREQALMFLSAAHPMLPDNGSGNDPLSSLFNLLSARANQ